MMKEKLSRCNEGRGLNNVVHPSEDVVSLSGAFYSVLFPHANMFLMHVMIFSQSFEGYFEYGEH